MSADRDALHAQATARQVVGVGAQVGALVDAIAQIRTAAQAASDLSSGVGWYMVGDMTMLLPDEDAALLLACEPVRLLQILRLAEIGLACSYQSPRPAPEQQGFHPAGATSAPAGFFLGQMG